MEQSFPEYFHENFYNHMVLIQESETKYLMEPPIQLDWHFRIKKISDMKWHVKGHKEDYEDYDEIFEFQNGKWRIL